jgi:hypothetical protein
MKHNRVTGSVNKCISTDLAIERENQITLDRIVKKIHFFEISLLFLLAVIVIFFGFISESHAQSVQEWSAPVNLSSSGAASNPLLLVDGSGVLHALWVDEFDGYKYSSSTDSLIWTPSKTVNFPFSPDDFSPVFLIGPEGMIHIFWRTKQNDLRYAQSLPSNFDDPASWSRLITLDSSVYDFDVTIDADSVFHIGYIRNPTPATSSAGVYYRRSQNGSTWSKAALLYESQYFRSLDVTTAHVRIEASNGNVYAVWDDRSLKRAFLARSNDAGNNWGMPAEIIVPEASQGFRTPYNSEIIKFNNDLLLVWQVGDPGIRCTPFSSTSSDGGKTWGTPIPILAESAQCPEKSEFISMDPAYSVLLFTIQGNLSISAWNGSQWSNPEIQSGPSEITNPATFDRVQLACRQAAVYQDRLFVVGCDQGLGGDVWLIARKLEPLQNLFPTPSAWSGDATVTTVSQTITSLSSIADTANNVHAVWIQALGSATNPIESRIVYSRWNGSEWTQPAPIFSDLSGPPLNLSLGIDSQDRLLLSWVNQQTGDLLFTWASSERANIPVEWIQPALVSSTSSLTNSPDILVDSSDRIVIAYAITLNESRGIYLVQSTDGGETWSQPIRVFDAVSANWDMVDRPKLAVTEDGKLHILFTKYSLLGNQQPLGVYYSQSADGGTTWTNPEVISEQPVQWNEIGASGETLHRFWQEKNITALTTFHQVSFDGGNIWNAPETIPTDADIISEPSVSIDWTGKVHLLQMVKESTQTLREWDWENERWQLSETRKLGIPKPDSQIKLASGITTAGKLYVVVQFEEPVEQGVETNLLNVSRSLEITEAVEPSLTFISTPSMILPPTSTSELVPVTPTLVSPLAGIEDTPSPINKNVVGLFLVSGVMFLILLFLLPGRSKKPRGAKPAKKVE